jgi:hypothetical protein
VSHFVLVLVVVLVLERDSFSEHFELPTNPIFATTHRFLIVRPPNTASFEDEDDDEDEMGLSLNAHSPPTLLLCSKIDEVADSLTFVRGPRLTSRPSAGKAARPKTALRAKAMRKSETAYSP